MIQRINSGSKNLDLILGGGLPADSITLISGETGTGKTTLAHQILFSNLKEGMHAIYLSTLGEPAQKIIKNMQEFDFFDTSVLTRSIYYEDTGELLAKEGIHKFVDFIFYSLMQYAPRFYCIDGIHRLKELSESEADYSRFLYELTGLFSAYRCSTIWLGAYGSADLAKIAETSVSDHVLELSGTREGNRSLRVVKLSRSHFVPGDHSYSISEQGVRVSPRFAAPARSRKPAAREPMQWGGEPFDKIFGKSLWKGAVVLLKGPTGSGKTTQGLHFVASGLPQGERGAIISFKEDPIDLAGLAQGFQWNLKAAVDQGTVGLMFHPPVEINFDDMALRMMQSVREAGAQRVFVNDIHYLFQSYSGHSKQLFEYIYSLVRYFRIAGISLVMSFGHGADPSLIEELSDFILTGSCASEKSTVIYRTELTKGAGVSHAPETVLLKPVAAPKGVESATL